ncbi:MAG: serine/threonine-protein kinase, partial [Planctomycetota bacterium]
MDVGGAKQVEELFQQAMDLPADQRSRFLDDRCRSDAALRREVESLLRCGREAPESFLERPPGSAPWPADAPGTTIGPYKIIEAVGEGAFGDVYLAEQTTPVRRRVALKIVKLGMDTKQVVARFEAERQALALMDHPNIAKVYDAGATESGRPYFAMEFVPGESLTAYCDEHRLDTDQRLHLFLQVCDAIQHAHQKGIIHRDIKPSNLLVERIGDHHVPKVIDFGIAKAMGFSLTERTLYTEEGQLIGTPEYMSPEQAELSGLNVDTRTDIYALGVVLYELLVGVSPFDPKTFRVGAIQDIQRRIREDQPPTPSTRISRLGPAAQDCADRRGMDPSSLRRRLTGDLDWIIMKAMEKECSRRYASASELAADIERHLRHEPVLAGPPSTVYRLGKFVRRNKTLVGGVMISLALLVAGAGAVTWQLMQTREEAAKATAINQFLTKLLALANPEEGQDGLVAQQWSGRVPTVVELIDEASRELETACPEWPDVRGELYFRLGKTYWGLGRNDEMRSHFARAYELRAEALGEDDPETLVTLVWWAFALEFERPLDALRMHERAAEGLTRLLGPGDPRTLFAHISLGDNLAVLGRLQESERVFRETIDLARRHLGPQHRTTLMAVSTAGLHLVGAGKPHEAERLVREPLEISRHSLPEADPTTADLARVLGNALKDQGRPAEALEFLQEAYAWEHRDSPGVSRSALRATFTLARAFRDLGRPSEAEPLYRKKLEDCRRELGDHEFTVWALFVLGDFLRTQGRLDDAETLLGTAVDHYGQALGEDEFHVLWAKRTLALVFRDQGRLEEAERLLKNA